MTAVGLLEAGSVKFIIIFKLRKSELFVFVLNETKRIAVLLKYRV
jgi:hypothetical protein